MLPALCPVADYRMPAAAAAHRTRAPFPLHQGLIGLLLSSLTRRRTAAITDTAAPPIPTVTATCTSCSGCFPEEATPYCSNKQHRWCRNCLTSLVQDALERTHQPLEENVVDDVNAQSCAQPHTQSDIDGVAPVSVSGGVTTPPSLVIQCTHCAVATSSTWRDSYSCSFPTQVLHPHA